MTNASNAADRIPARRHIAVIGAGLAGLASATEMQRAGHQVTVFEKSRGPGGRMSTRRGDDHGRAWQCDHGAQYFTARDVGFVAEVARWREAGVAADWQPKLQVLGGRAAHSVVDGRDGSSKEPTTRIVGTPGMTAPARWLAASLDVHAGITVRALHREDGDASASGSSSASGPATAQWRLRTEEGGMWNTPFDAVLLAVPAPQATAILQATASENAMPAAGCVLVPELLAAAQSARMRPCWALMARFDAPLGMSFDAAFVNSGPLRWVARDSGKPGRTGPETWSLHASAEWSQAHVDATPDAVIADLLAAFGQLGTSSAPAACSAHRWLYSDAAATAHAIGSQFSAADAVGLCGDWMQGGRVEGAWLSGTSLARMVNEHWRAA